MGEQTTYICCMVSNMYFMIIDNGSHCIYMYCPAPCKIVLVQQQYKNPTAQQLCLD